MNLMGERFAGPVESSMSKAGLDNRHRNHDETATRLVPMLREYTVFNVDQCENLPDSVNTGKPMRVRNPDTRDELANAFLGSTGADRGGQWYAQSVANILERA
jgi:antirestriction protein ArdC